MANPYRIKQLDISSGGAGFGSFIKSMGDRQKRKEEEEEQRQMEQLRGAAIEEEAMRRGFVSQQDQPGLVEPDLAEANVFNSPALNPEQAMVEREAIAGIGIDTPEKIDDAIDFAGIVEETPDAELNQVISDRIQQGVAEGRDMRDSAGLIGKPPEEIRAQVATVSNILSNEKFRQLYAKSPKEAKMMADFIRTSTEGGQGLSVSMREFDRWNQMDEGDPKEAFGRMIGAKSKLPSYQDRYGFEHAKEMMKTDENLREFTEKQAIKLGTEAELASKKTTAEEAAKVEAAGSKAEQTALGRERATLKKDMRGAATEARRSIPKIQNVIGMLEQVETGRWQQAGLALKRVIPGFDPSDQEAVQAAITKFTLDELSKQSGTKTDFDFLKAAEASAAGDKSSAGNIKILQQLIRDLEMRTDEERQFKEFGGDVLDFEYRFQEAAAQPAAAGDIDAQIRQLEAELGM